MRIIAAPFIAAAGIGIAFLPAFGLAKMEVYRAPYRQDRPPQPEPVSEETKRANVELVFGYYRSMHDMSESNLLRFLAEDFIQHDVCEPDDVRARAKMFRDSMEAGGLPEDLDPEPKIKGAVDKAGQPLIRSIVADGDLVVVIRDIARRWPGGPVPWMKTTWVDIWRVKNGKMTEQWNTAVPGDGFDKPSGNNCACYHDDPTHPIPASP